MYEASGTVDKDKSVAEFAPLVKRIAYHLMAKLPPSVQVDDLIQVGLMGLLDAVNHYDGSQGAQFETYARQRIRGAMLDELRHSDWLPRSARKSLRQIESAISALQQRFGRHPSEQELAAEMNLPLDEYQQMLHSARGVQLLHYEDLAGGEDDDYLARHCVDDQPTPFDRVMDADFRAMLVKAIANLPEREKMLMGLYYEQELNLREIGELMGISESRVCQLHSQAVARLRTRLKDWIKD
ncbi:MAG: RNA polymerase sigma factor FliA [Burkholderiales bacterium]